MHQAREVILLADAAKLGRVSFASSGSAADVGVLITDSKIDEEMEQELSQQGVNLIYACECTPRGVRPLERKINE